MYHKDLACKKHSKRDSGFTLLESLITLAVFSLIAAAATSSYHNFISNKRLENAATQIYTDLKLARSEAMKQKQNIFVSFSQKNGNWCYGLNENAPCNCMKLDDCHLKGNEKVVRGDSFQDIELQQARFAGKSTSTAFEPTRGFASGNGVKNGTIWLKANNDSQIAIIINRVGRVRFCSEDLGAYAGKCPKPPKL